MFWEGVPGVGYSHREIIASNSFFPVSFGSFQAVGSGFGLAEIKLWVRGFVDAMDIFEYINHVATLSPVFKAGELQYFEAFGVGLLLQRRQQAGGSSLYILQVLAEGFQIRLPYCVSIFQNRSHLSLVEL